LGLKTGELIAYVSPGPVSAGYPIDQLDRLLEGLPHLTAVEAEHFLKDIHCGVATQPVETDAWAS